MSWDAPRAAGRRPWGPAIGTVALFAALGPPIGGLVFAFLVTFIPGLAGALNSDASLAESTAGGLAGFIFMSLFTVPFSYLVGAIPAAINGVLIAAWGWFKGRPTLPVGLLAGLAVYGVFSLRFGYLELTAAFFSGVFLIFIVPALLCWLIARTFWGPQA